MSAIEVDNASIPSTKEDVLRVKGGTPPQQLAGSISKAMAQDGKCTLAAIGAGAVNQAVKGLAIARSLVATTGRDLIFTVGMETSPDVNNRPGLNGSEDITRILLRAEYRP